MLKELWWLVVIAGLFYVRVPKDNLPINPGVYPLESSRNVATYIPRSDSKSNTVSDTASKIAGQIVTSILVGDSDNSEVEQIGQVTQTGEKPSVLSKVKISDRGDLKFESYPYPPLNLKYATISLGTYKQAFKMAFLPGNGYIQTIYFDRNGDGIIGKNEIFNVLATQLERTFSTTEKDGHNLKKEISGFNYSSQVDDIAVSVKYDKSDGTAFCKDIYISFYFCNMQNPSYSTENTVSLSYEVKNYFAGTCSVNYKGQKKEMNFILVDQNNNGVFADFNKDRLYMDINGDEVDEIYTLKKHLRIGKSSLHLSLSDYPECLVVKDSTVPSPEQIGLEPGE